MAKRAEVGLIPTQIFQGPMTEQAHEGPIVQACPPDLSVIQPEYWPAHHMKIDLLSRTQSGNGAGILGDPGLP
jgi:hypothetical protein